MHNTCEDSLFATPLIYDLVILAELCQRVTIKKVHVNEEQEGIRGGMKLPIQDELNHLRGEAPTGLVIT